MTEPNALDRMFNAVVSDREVKKMVKAQTKKLFDEALALRLPEDVAVQEIKKQLTQWITEKGLTGRGTKKMVDKAVARATKSYRRSLHELNSSSEFDRFRDTPDHLLGSWADRASDQVRSPWRRSPSVWVGRRVADAFGRKQK